MKGSVLDGVSPFRMLGLSFCYKLDWGSDNVSIYKTSSKENYILGSFYEFSFSWGCSLPLSIYHTVSQVILLSCLSLFPVVTSQIRYNIKTKTKLSNSLWFGYRRSRRSEKFWEKTTLKNFIRLSTKCSWWSAITILHSLTDALFSENFQSNFCETQMRRCFCHC